MSSRKVKDELELLEQQLKSLQSGKRQPGTYGQVLSNGSGMKVAQDKLKRRIEEIKPKLKEKDK